MVKTHMLAPVYTFDPFDKNSLNFTIGSYGYTVFSIITEPINDEKEADIFLYHSSFLKTIACRLIYLFSNTEVKKDFIDFNKDTLVVIIKNTREAYVNKLEKEFNKEISIPGLNIAGKKLL